MSRRALSQELHSPDEYLERELESPVKHEFVDGAIYAMAGVSDRHGIVCVNFVIAIGNRLPEGCQLYTADMKLRIKTEAVTLFYYPDVLLSCSRDDRGNSYFREKPTLIVEVLSPSTERIDRTEKFDAYRRIPSLAEYVLADQDMPKVEIFRRRTAWARETSYPEDRFTLESVGLDLTMEQVYRGVAF